jgi:hypothetical protein
MFAKLNLLKNAKLASKIKPDKKGVVHDYLSRTKLHLCKNPDCKNMRRENSAWCGREDCGKKDDNQNI